ncbi:SH3 domain-containing protein [Roseomonas populi]|uniref:SH3 domain-containing protein n=1 Tax=Roseomonas populi TaxID=3121582 RepID=UPI0027E38E85|nr:SH3 domain-containing protein [Roseomonas pecuniae]
MRYTLIPAAALLLGLANPASAAPGFATGSVNLRAGPGTSYPKVVVVPAGAGVEIFGCLAGYSWCDVGFGGVRGWVSSSYLQYTYEARRVPLPRYAPQSGVPIVTFSFGDYWRDNYRGRSWYAERDRWGGPPPRAAYAPPGPGWRPGPPGQDWREREARQDWQDHRRENRQDVQRERRENRQDWQEFRRDQAQDRREDRRDQIQDRREQVQDRREERRDQIQERREERRDDRRDDRPGRPN